MYVERAAVARSRSAEFSGAGKMAARVDRASVCRRASCTAFVKWAQLRCPVPRARLRTRPVVDAISSRCREFGVSKPDLVYAGAPTEIWPKRCACSACPTGTTCRSGSSRAPLTQRWTGTRCAGWSKTRCSSPPTRSRTCGLERLRDDIVIVSTARRPMRPSLIGRASGRTSTTWDPQTGGRHGVSRRAAAASVRMCLSSRG